MSRSIKQQLAENGFFVSTTSGFSMWPMLRDRKDRVIIKPIGEGRLKRLDLPLYLRPDGVYVLHRVIGVRDGYYVIRGDNTYVKEKIPDAWIIGYVTEFYRGERHVSTNGRWYRIYAALRHAVFCFAFAVSCFRKNKDCVTNLCDVRA